MFVYWQKLDIYEGMPDRLFHAICVFSEGDFKAIRSYNIDQ